MVRRSASIALVCLALLAALLSGCGPGSVATPTATTEASPDTSAVIEVTASVPSVANPTAPAETTRKARASELSRVSVVSARDMKTTGWVVPRKMPP